MTSNLADSGFAFFGAAKNLLVALHDLDMAVVLWIANLVGVNIPDGIVTALGVGLMFLVAFGIFRAFITSLKHCAIIAGVVVGAILLIPFWPGSG